MTILSRDVIIGCGWLHAKTNLAQLITVHWAFSTAAAMGSAATTQRNKTVYVEYGGKQLTVTNNLACRRLTLQICCIIPYADCIFLSLFHARSPRFAYLGCWNQQVSACNTSYTTMAATTTLVIGLYILLRNRSDLLQMHGNTNFWTNIHAKQIGC